MRRARLLPFALALLSVACGGGGGGSDDSGSGDDGDDGGGGSPVPAIEWTDVDDFAYQLQGLNLTTLGASAFDLLVIDPTADGGDSTAWSAAQVAALRASPGGAKRVLAYLSIGEAEEYRSYWNPAWDANGDGVPDVGAPAWLSTENPAWPGNYTVRYWDPAWQALVLARIDDLVARGYDGVYLDIVDAYEWWGPDGGSGLDRASAEAEMVALVEEIAQRARVDLGVADFGVFPQNAEGLLAHADYLTTITGIGREDLWTDGDVPQPLGDVAAALGFLDAAQAAGKLVMVVDYATQAVRIDALYAAAGARGFLAHAPPRDLDVLTVNAGHAPD